MEKVTHPVEIDVVMALVQVITILAVRNRVNKVEASQYGNIGLNGLLIVKLLYCLIETGPHQ